MLRKFRRLMPYVQQSLAAMPMLQVFDAAPRNRQQFARLAALSIAENIGFGRPAASRDEIVAAAVAAHADAFIRRLPEGYDTVIGHRGATLSIGQQQRLAIARALVKDAPVLVLDEPTSALDAQTESLLLAALEQLWKGRTTFVVSHRLSTIRRADRILVVDAGRIVESGTHEQLLAAGGLYAGLHEVQRGVAPAARSPSIIA